MAPTAAYVGLVQTGFLRGFLNRKGKHRNPEDSCRNYQPSLQLRQSGIAQLFPNHRQGQIHCPLQQYHGLLCLGDCQEMMHDGSQDPYY